MPTSDRAASLAQPPTNRPLEGLRVVSRNAGRCLDVVSSPSSTYLLPDLADFSLLNRETRSDQSLHLLIEDEGVLIQSSTSADAAGTWQGWLGNLAGLRGISLGFLHASEPQIFSWPASPEHVIEKVLLQAVPPPTQVTRSAVAVAPSMSVALSERTATTSPVTEVSRVAQRLSALSSLTDEQLSQIFKVERETFARWKSGALTNPRVGSRRRLGLMLRLFDELTAKHVVVKDWLLNQVTPEGRTPFEMLKRGSFDQVALLSAELPLPPTGEAPLGLAGNEPPLDFLEDDVWELETDDDI